MQIIHAMVMVVRIPLQPKVTTSIVRPPILTAPLNQRVPMKLLNIYSKTMTMFLTRKMAVCKCHLNKLFTIL